MWVPAWLWLNTFAVAKLGKDSPSSPVTCFPEKSTSRSVSLRSAPAPYSCSLQNCWGAVAPHLSSQITMAERQELEQTRPLSCSPLKTTGTAWQGKSSCRKTSASFAGLELDLCLQLLPMRLERGSLLCCFPASLQSSALLPVAPCIPASLHPHSCRAVPRYRSGSLNPAASVLLCSHSSRGISPSSL